MTRSTIDLRFGPTCLSRLYCRTCECERIHKHNVCSCGTVYDAAKLPPVNTRMGLKPPATKQRAGGRRKA